MASKSREQFLWFFRAKHYAMRILDLQVPIRFNWCAATELGEEEAYSPASNNTNQDKASSASHFAGGLLEKAEVLN